MTNYRCRAREEELLDLIREYGVTDEDILSHFLCYLDSDTTCAVLEDYCNDYDIEIDDDED